MAHWFESDHPIVLVKWSIWFIAREIAQFDSAIAASKCRCDPADNLDGVA